MWVDAGFEPDTFWHQSPRSFQLAMEGVRRRAERDAEAGIVMAWQTAAFVGAAQGGKLKPLKHYLGKRGAKRQAPAEMLAIFHGFKAAGANMKIRRVEYGRDLPPAGPS